MKEKTIIAQNIRTLRKEKGWTQEQLAQETRLPLRSIINYENERRDPCGTALVALEQVFGVTEAQLYGLRYWPSRPWCGQVIFSGTLAPGAEATVEIPQSCPRCSVTGGCGDE